MSTSSPFADTLPADHVAVCRTYAGVQERCTRLMAQQQAEIAHLQAQVVRLRAAAIVRVSALAFVRADLALLSGPLARWQASMAAADSVICQTGCLSHGAYWRDNEQCRRTGKACTVPDAPVTTHLTEKTGSDPCQ